MISLRLFALLSAVTVIAAGCSGSSPSTANSGAYYLYTYSMEYPEQKPELRYRDENIDIAFSVDESAVTFQLLNISDQQVSVAWERAAIGVNMRMYPVRNNTTFYSMGHAAPQPLTVPPKGILRETVIPWNSVNFEKGRWTERTFFPVNDSGMQKVKGMIESLVGSEITLVLPVRVGKLVMDYQFTFKIASVNPLPPGTAPPEKERPPRPDAPMYESSIMQGYLPIVISAGILAVAIIIFTQKKVPAEGL